MFPAVERAPEVLSLILQAQWRRNCNTTSSKAVLGTHALTQRRMGPTMSCSYGDHCLFFGRSDGASPQLNECGAANCKRQLHHMCQAELENIYKEQLGETAMSKRCLTCLLKECGVSSIPSHVVANERTPRRTSPRRQPRTPERPRASAASTATAERRSPRLLMLASAADSQHPFDADADFNVTHRSSPRLQQSKSPSVAQSTRASVTAAPGARRDSEPDTSGVGPEDDDNDDVDTLPARKRGGQPGKRSFGKRVALSNEHKVKIVSYYLSFPAADRPKHIALAEWAKAEFKFNSLPSKAAISTLLKKKDEIMSKCPLPAVCSLLYAPCCLLRARSTC